MYSPLPSRPGPVTLSRLAAPLRGTLRVFNALFGAIGTVLIATSLWIFIVYHRTGLLPPDPDPGIDPFPDARTLLSDTGGDNDSLWFVWAVGGTGIYFLAVASSGMGGLQEASRHRLFLHIILVSGLILAEAVALVVLFTDNSLRRMLPDDPTGFWPATEEFIDENPRLIKLGGLSTIMVQLVGLGAACWLHSLYQRAYEDWIDGIAAAEQRTYDQLGRTAQQAYAGTGPSVWRSRMEGKYGLSAGQWQAAAATAVAVQSSGLVDEGAPAPLEP